ncbi:MAG TPA: response regulator transcription factor [Actinomycetota bacterium]|nr:response regulator transcription factor [Actinomycetota bacterium]
MIRTDQEQATTASDRSSLPARMLLFDGWWSVGHSMPGDAEAEGDLRLVAETGDPPSIAEEVPSHGPDVAIVDADLIGSELPSVITKIRTSRPTCKILVIISTEEVGPLVAALEAGANGYLTKSASIWDLLEATRRVCRGDAVIPPRMLGRLLATLVDERTEIDGMRQRVATLTRREREVLALLADGFDKVAIARMLVISPHTARTHVHNILTKLGLHSQLQAAAFARDAATRETIGAPHAAVSLRTRLDP